MIPGSLLQIIVTSIIEIRFTSLGDAVESYRSYTLTYIGY